MKIVLSKTKTAIILLLITVIFLGFYTFMLTRPISYGLKYHNETIYQGYHFEGSFVFHRDGTTTIDNSNYDEPFESYYYYKDGYIITLMATNETEREEEVALIEANSEDLSTYDIPFKVNAFTYDAKESTPDLPMIYACKSLFVFAVFGGIFAVAMIVFTCSSLVLSIKAKRANIEITGSEKTLKSGYKEQQNLSFVQFLAETPAFIAVLASAILSKTLLVFVDLLDSFGNLLRTAMVTILSKKLSKDLRFEYNYGVGKIEAITSLFCDSIVLLGLLITLGLSIYSIIFPDPPSDLVIAVVGLKVINVSFDTAFFVKQRKIIKTHRSAISETNYAAAKAALLFDSVALVSLLVMWLLRTNLIGGYISPVISIFVAIYLMIGCFKRAMRGLDELTDKTLPEELQMKILNILNQHYNSYSQFHSINSLKSGDVTRIDIHLSFEKNTSFEDIVNLKKQMQDECDRQFGNCIVNIIVSDN